MPDGEGDPQFFVDQIFRVLDGDNNGFIDFTVLGNIFIDFIFSVFHYQEFMLAVDMSSSGTPEQKLKWAFKIFDKDHSGQFVLLLWA